MTVSQVEPATVAAAAVQVALVVLGAPVLVGVMRQVRARLITLVIGGSAGDLGLISDETHEVHSLSVTEEAVGRVLSV